MNKEQVYWLVERNGQIMQDQFGDTKYFDLNECREFVDYMRRGFSHIEWKVIRRTIIEVEE
jgi:hypothetical protein